MIFPPRDLVGYGPTPPTVTWPNNARVAVSFVLNFEEGSEHSIADGDARNEGIYEVIDKLEGIPDPCIQSHFDYGTRVGWWRIMDLLERHVHTPRNHVSDCWRGAFVRDVNEV